MKVLEFMGITVLVMAFVLFVSAKYLHASTLPFFEYIQYATLTLTVSMVIGTVSLYLIFIYKYNESSRNPEKSDLDSGHSVDLKLALKESKSILVSLSLALLSSLIISQSVV